MQVRDFVRQDQTLSSYHKYRCTFIIKEYISIYESEEKVIESNKQCFETEGISDLNGDA